MRRKSAEVVGRSETAGLLLMADLRELYLAAQHAELAWVILLQAAKAKRDAELIDVVTQCHEEAEMCGKWLRTRIKEAAPQVYAAGRAVGSAGSGVTYMLRCRHRAEV